MLLPRIETTTLLATVLIGTASAVHTQDTKLTERLEAKVYESKDHGKLPYRLFVPTGYATSGKRYPLVLFLHGAGERGSDNARQLRHGVGDFVSAENQAKRPAFVLAPQCAKGQWWPRASSLDLVFDLLASVRKSYPIDAGRIYITGLSMGGFGTWAAIARRPKLFAAAIPICGAGDPKSAGKLVSMPIWAFHGDADRAVNVEESRKMIAAIKEAGGHPKYTEYPGVGHNSWTRTYADPKVHEWLFAQRRQAPALAVSLKDGDRVAFLGDSITSSAVRKNGFIRLIEADLHRTRPDWHVDLIGAGVSGNKVPDLQKRLDRDVIAKKPTIVIVYIGINDVWHWNKNRGTKKDVYEAGLRDVIARIQAAGSRVILATPSVIGEKTDGSNRFDKMLDEYSVISRRVATQAGVELLDLHKRFRDYLRAHNPENKPRGILTRDRVHLNDTGNRFVADRMLEALGVAAKQR